MKTYFIYRYKDTNEIKVHLSKTEWDAERVKNIMKNELDKNGLHRYENIHTFSDNDMFFAMLTIGLNRMLNELHSPVLFARDKISTDNRICLNVKLANDMFVDSCILNMSNAFWNIIEDVLTTFELDFSYNNTRSCIFIIKKVGST
jgi:hypothetical protein